MTKKELKAKIAQLEQTLKEVKDELASLPNGFYIKVCPQGCGETVSSTSHSITVPGGIGRPYGYETGACQECGVRIRVEF